jgi:hypothetical protein
VAAFEAVLSFGLAVAYIAAGPVLQVLSPQAVYRVAALGAGGALLILLPLLRLRTDAGEIVREDEPSHVVVMAGEAEAIGPVA